MKVIATATIERGVKTNRVRVRKRPGGDPIAGPEVAPEARRGRQRPTKGRFRADPSRPRGWKAIGVSVAPEELAAIDARAEELGLSRSRLMTVGALAFGAGLTADEVRLLELVRGMTRR